MAPGWKKRGTSDGGMVHPGKTRRIRTWAKTVGYEDNPPDTPRCPGVCTNTADGQLKKWRKRKCSKTHRIIRRGGEHPPTYLSKRHLSDGSIQHARKSPPSATYARRPKKKKLKRRPGSRTDYLKKKRTKTHAEKGGLVAFASLPGSTWSEGSPPLGSRSGPRTRQTALVGRKLSTRTETRYLTVNA